MPASSSPLPIAEIRPATGHGRIGLAPCPGKMDGGEARDLAADLDAIANWGAVALVSLVEAEEFTLLQVPGLGDALRRRHIGWHHAPIRDFCVPDQAFEARWSVIGEGLRSAVRSGFDVVLHCRGGLGRSGMIAARLMAELGHAPAEAIEAVRAVRPGAIETDEQLAHVHAVRPVPEAVPSTDPESRRDRALGALIGLAVGDAVGTTLEFKTRDDYEPLTDMVGGGPFRLKPGQWTDDTAMALALAESLVADGHLDEADTMRRFVSWVREGTYSCTGACVDIGNATSAALRRFEKTGKPRAGSTDRATAGNGSLMRLASVAVRHWADPDALDDIATRQSLLTHAAPQAIDACRFFARVLARAIHGAPFSEVVGKPAQAYAPAIAAIAAGSWRGKARREILSTGYVVHTLEAALWAVGRSTSFREAILTAANLGRDADTVAAVAGQLAGARWGISSIPRDWLRKLAWCDRISAAGEALFEAGQRAQASPVRATQTA